MSLPPLENLSLLRIARQPGREMTAQESRIMLDSARRQLVEAHFWQESSTLVCRAARSQAVRSAALIPVLETGKWNGRPCFTTPLVDGEGVRDYVERRGPLPPATVFSLVFPLLEELLRWQDEKEPVYELRPDQVLVTTVEGAFLQLKVTGLGGASVTGERLPNSLVTQACHLLFLMLTGKSCQEGQADRLAVVGSLPASLGTTLRSVMNGGEASISLERLRDEVRGGLGLVSGGMQARMMKKQIAVIQAFQPWSRLHDLLGKDRSAERLLKDWNCTQPVTGAPFIKTGEHPRTGNPLTAHLLPTECLERALAVAPEIWRVQREKHPNILRCLALKEGQSWSLLAEDAVPGFSLARLLAERGSLNPQETALVLRQVYDGLRQAAECGLPQADLRPGNVLLQVGKNGPLMHREHERLMQKRLDVWPAFRVRLRLHPTLQSLLEPPLDGGAPQGNQSTRALAALAVWLICGQRPGKEKPVFPDAVPMTLASFLASAWENPRHSAAPPLAPSAFLDRFENLMVTPALLFKLAARPQRPPSASEETESAGCVSDFEEDWQEEISGEPDADSRIFPRQGRPVTFGRRWLGKSTRWQVLAASLVALISLSGWWLFSKELPPLLAQPGPAPQQHPPVPRQEVHGLAASAAKTSLAMSHSAAPQIRPKPKPCLFDWKPQPPLQPAYAHLLSGNIKSQAPAKADEPPTPHHESQLNTGGEATSALAPLPFSQEPAPVVRRALIPTPEEIAQFKQGQGEMPDGRELYTAQPEPPLYP